jgi:uncharacterized protein YcaQ
VAALFLARQHLDQPRARRLTASSLTRFVEDAGGIQLDSINVVDRAHYLTLWSRFGPFRRAVLDELVYGRRVLFEYWAHVACLVPITHLPAWRRVMLDYQRRHKGWAAFLRKNPTLLRTVEDAIRDRGPLGNADFQSSRPAGRRGWWDWKPATHALDFLWMSGRTAIHSRVHFQKRFDLLERVLPAALTVAPLAAPTFRRWHLERSLHAMGAATETDLRMYLTFPRAATVERRIALREMLASGEVVEVRVEADRGRWYALARDLDPLAAAGRKGAASRGSTLLSPFDSLLWHRERVRRLFGFDYRIEVYVPGSQRKFGYYVLPLLVDGQLVGRADTKLYRHDQRLELRHVHFEPWLVTGKAPAALPSWRAVTMPRALTGLAEAAWSLAKFTGATQVDLDQVTPASARPCVRKALERAESAFDSRLPRGNRP